MILYVNCCPREGSRTHRLATKLLSTLGEYTEVCLETSDLQPLRREVLEFREKLIQQRDFSDPIFDYAKQFMQADTIVIAAPYWDSTFPALLRTYIEHIYVTGLVTKYGPKGVPIGLCNAKKLYYVTTAGGPYDPRFSYDYLKEIAQVYFGIAETELIYAQMLDVQGYDAEAILQECEMAMG